MIKKIERFRDKYYFLSNFYDCPVVIDKIKYSNAESAFQAMKCENKDERMLFTTLSGRTAKNLGRKIKLREDWNEIRLSIMKEIILDKFKRNLNLKEKLLATENIELIEGNTWNDTFWGVDLYTGAGENNLGKILMEVRKELRNALSK